MNAITNAHPGFDGNPLRERQVRDPEGEGKREIVVQFRHDRLNWLLEHGHIEQHHHAAGERFRKDWQGSKIEVCSASNVLVGASQSFAQSSLSDSRCDAMDRVNDAMRVLPGEIAPLLAIFLIPIDHPWSLERCAAFVRMNRRAALPMLRAGLSILSKHYGYG